MNKIDAKHVNFFYGDATTSASLATMIASIANILK